MKISNFENASEILFKLNYLEAGTESTIKTLYYIAYIYLTIKKYKLCNLILKSLMNFIQNHKEFYYNEYI